MSVLFCYFLKSQGFSSASPLIYTKSAWVLTTWRHKQATSAADITEGISIKAEIWHRAKHRAERSPSVHPSVRYPSDQTPHWWLISALSFLHHPHTHPSIHPSITSFRLFHEDFSHSISASEMRRCWLIRRNFSVIKSVMSRVMDALWKISTLTSLFSFMWGN